MSIPTNIQVALPHTEGITWTDCHGQDFTVNRIQHWAFICRGRLVVDTTVFGGMPSGETTNATIDGNDHPFEQPPVWFKVGVEEMRMSVEPANA